MDNLNFEARFEDDFEEEANLCAAWHEDDCAESFDKTYQQRKEQIEDKDEDGKYRPAKAKRHQMQLASQIRRALLMACSGAGNTMLQRVIDLEVDVSDPKRACVWAACDPADAEDLQWALPQASNYLRQEVARAINRKRVPMLQWIVVALDEAGVDDDGEELADDDTDYAKCS